MTRSIPAWAGKPLLYHATKFLFAVYPRVGGETTVDDRETTALQRVYPRVGGETGQAVASVSGLACKGLSPRGRGNLVDADAMEPDEAGLSPRGRGNQRISTYPSAGQAGLSPRGRGNL